MSKDALWPGKNALMPQITVMLSNETQDGDGRSERVTLPGRWANGEDAGGRERAPGSRPSSCSGRPAPDETASGVSATVMARSTGLMVVANEVKLSLGAVSSGASGARRPSQTADRPRWGRVVASTASTNGAPAARLASWQVTSLPSCTHSGRPGVPDGSSSRSARGSADVTLEAARGPWFIAARHCSAPSAPPRPDPSAPWTLTFRSAPVVASRPSSRR